MSINAQEDGNISRQSQNDENLGSLPVEDVNEQRPPAGKTFVRPKGLPGPDVEVAAANFNNPSMEPKGKVLFSGNSTAL